MRTKEDTKNKVRLKRLRNRHTKAMKEDPRYRTKPFKVKKRKDTTHEEWDD